MNICYGKNKIIKTIIPAIVLAFYEVINIIRHQNA